MLNKITLFALFFVVYTNQSHSQSLNNLKAINKTWEKFYEAFDSLDYKLMEEIHSKELIRISGGKRILDYKTYINNYKARFKASKENNSTSKIALLFFERINSDSTASERGIYKLIVNNNQGKTQSYYGQFHVIFKKENDTWKIWMDYDSSENDTIGEEQFIKAHPINQLDKFIQN